jgi:hypothetical protein
VTRARHHPGAHISDEILALDGRVDRRLVAPEQLQIVRAEPISEK